MKNKIFWDAIHLYKEKNKNNNYKNEILRIKGLNSFVLSIEKQGYEECFSENMKNIITNLGFENLNQLINEL